MRPAEHEHEDDDDDLENAAAADVGCDVPTASAAHPSSHWWCW